MCQAAFPRMDIYDISPPMEREKNLTVRRFSLLDDERATNKENENILTQQLLQRRQKQCFKSPVHAV